MTLQIAMIAEDGILIASDTRISEIEQGRTSSEISKLFFHQELNAVYSCAGSDLANNAGDRTFEKMLQHPQGNIGTLAKDAAKEIWNEQFCGHNGPREGQKRGWLFIAAIVNAKPELWRLQVSSNPYCVNVLEGKAIHGDESNTSQFFSETYFPAEPTTLNNLLSLAAHVVLMGAKINPTGVHGLEIAICRAGECRKLTSTEMAPLYAISSGIHESIAKQLGQAPDVIR